MVNNVVVLDPCFSTHAARTRPTTSDVVCPAAISCASLLKAARIKCGKQSLLCLVYYCDCTYLILLLISPPTFAAALSILQFYCRQLCCLISSGKINQSVHDVLRVARFHSEPSWDQRITWSTALLRAALCLCCGAARTFGLLYSTPFVLAFVVLLPCTVWQDCLFCCALFLCVWEVVFFISSLG